MKFWRARLLVALVPIAVLLAPGSHGQQGADPTPIGMPPQPAIEGPLERGPDGEVEVAPAGKAAAPDQAPVTSRGPQRAQPNKAVPATRGGTIMRQIANAPGWRRRTSYAGGTNFTANRVLAGPGWNAGSPGGFTSGRPVFLWIAQNRGESADSGNGPQSCDAPGTSTVTESSGLVWKCLTRIDYDSITGYLFDDDDWQPGTRYLFNQYAVAGNPKRVYRINRIEVKGCTSGTSPPTGAGIAISDGGCAWDAVALLGYSSQAGHVPKQRYEQGDGTTPIIGLQNYHVGNIWYGGAARPEYIPGENGETDPILMVGHADFTNDDGTGETLPHCADGGATYPHCGASGTTLPTSFTVDYRITLQAQASDSFVNNPDAASMPLAYNAAHGVAIHAVTAPHAAGFSSAQNGGDAIDFYDSSLNFWGLQIKSDHGTALSGWPRANYISIQNDIVDAGGNMAIYLDALGAVVDSLVIVRGAQPSAVGVNFSYVGRLVNDTIVDLGGGPDSVCMLHTNFIFGVPSFQNVYCAGFVHQAAIRSTGVSTLAEDIDAGATTATTATPCCVDDVWANVDSEEMRITKATDAGGGKTMLTVERGILGTKAAPHRKGAVIAGGFDPSQSHNNAVSNAARTSVSAFSAVNSRYGSSNFPGVSDTCGADHNATCYGLSAADQFVNPTSDFRLKPTAALKGAGASAPVSIDLWNVPLMTASGIVAAERPPKGRSDIGAW